MESVSRSLLKLSASDVANRACCVCNSIIPIAIFRVLKPLVFCIRVMIHVRNSYTKVEVRRRRCRRIRKRGRRRRNFSPNALSCPTPYKSTATHPSRAQPHLPLAYPQTTKAIPSQTQNYEVPEYTNNLPPLQFPQASLPARHTRPPARKPAALRLCGCGSARGVEGPNSTHPNPTQI